MDALNCLTYYHEKNSKKVLVIGDSHGRDFFHSLRLAYPEVQVSMLHQSSCSPSYGPKATNSDVSCFEMLDDIIDRIEIFDVVFYASRYVSENTYDKFFREVKYRHKKSKIKVVIVNTTGSINKNVANYFHEHSSDGYFKISNALLKPIRVVNDNLVSLSGGNISVFDKASIFYKGDKRMLILNDQPLLFDNQHLSEPGIIYLARKIKESKVLD